MEKIHTVEGAFLMGRMCRRCNTLRVRESFGNFPLLLRGHHVAIGLEGNGGDFVHYCHGNRRISELALWATRFCFSQSLVFVERLMPQNLVYSILYFCPSVEHIRFLDNYETVQCCMKFFV